MGEKPDIFEHPAQSVRQETVEAKTEFESKRELQLCSMNAFLSGSSPARIPEPNEHGAMEVSDADSIRKESADYEPLSAMSDRTYGLYGRSLMGLPTIQLNAVPTA